MANYEEKMKVLFGTEEFAKAFDEVSTPEEMKELCENYGAELTNEEIAEVINAAVKESDADLDEVALENVNGGIFATLGAMLLGSWQFAVEVYGSPKAAVREIGLFWARKLGYKG